MKAARKILPYTAVVLLATLFTVQYTAATAPDIPQFTVQAIDHSGYVQPSPTYDPYLGETVTPPTYYVANRSVDLLIKNPPFTSSNPYVYMAYSVRYKGFYEQNWTYIAEFSTFTPGWLASNQTYTGISIPMEGFSAGGKVDFQVQAAIVTAHPMWPGSNIGTRTFEKSDWSPTQTVAVPQPSTSTPYVTQNPTVTSAVTLGGTVLGGFNVVEVAILAVLVVVAVLLAVLIVTLRSRKPAAL